MSDVTVVVEALQSGDPEVPAQLLPLVRGAAPAGDAPAVRCSPFTPAVGCRARSPQTASFTRSSGAAPFPVFRKVAR
jgi:hypothetical protein